MYLHNQRVGKVEIINKISKFFLYFLMKTEDYQWYILGSSSGTSIRHSSPTSICSYKFLKPSNEKEMEFDIIAKNLMNKVSKNNFQILTLEKMRDNLLPKLMSGEIRVDY